MHALDVGPAMRMAIENAVIGTIDCFVLVRPQPRFGRRVHPRVHRAGHEPGSELGKHTVDALDFGLKARREPIQLCVGSRILDLEDMQHQLVGPAKAPGFHIVRVTADHLA